MDTFKQQDHLADLSLAVRESSLKRFRVVPAGFENWRITRESMSVADLARHIVDADEWLFRKLVDPSLSPIDGNPGEVTITDRAQYDVLIERLDETGRERADLMRTMTDAALEKRIVEPFYGNAGEISVWWLLVRVNLDHEIHHRGALAVYLRVLKEREGAPIDVLP